MKILPVQPTTKYPNRKPLRSKTRGLVGITLPYLAGPPTENVKQVIERALDVLQTPPCRGEERRQMVKRIVDPYFDYRKIAKRSLGAAWGQLNADLVQRLKDKVPELRRSG